MVAGHKSENAMSEAWVLFVTVPSITDAG